MGSGGSVPLVAKLHEAYPDAAFVLWGAQDSDLAQIHAANESVDLSEIEKLALAEALLLAELGGRLIPPARGRSPRAGESDSALRRRRRVEHGHGGASLWLYLPAARPLQTAPSAGFDDYGLAGSELGRGSRISPSRAASVAASTRRRCSPGPRPGRG